MSSQRQSYLVVFVVVSIILFGLYQRSKRSREISNSASPIGLEKQKNNLAPAPQQAIAPSSPIRPTTDKPNEQSEPAPVDGQAQFQAQCTTKQTYLEVNQIDLKELAKFPKFFSLPRGRLLPCLEIGQMIHLGFASMANPQILVEIGKAIVLTPQNSEALRLQILELRMGRRLALVPTCYGYCDEVVTKFPAKKEGSIHFDLRIPQDIARWSWPEAIPVPITEAVSWKTLASKADQIKDKEVIVSIPRSQWNNTGIFEMFREIKTLGKAKKVIWYYPGASGRRGFPMYPPDLPELKKISGFEFRKLLRTQKAIPVFVGTQFDYDTFLKVLPPKSKHLKALTTAMAPDFYPSANGEEMEQPKNFDISLIPQKTERPIVVYGFSHQDWRPYYALKIMTKLGYQNLFWFPGGLDELQLMFDFNLVENARPN